jgi:succinate dehydrogenase/fumarate reductase flavoprotein subunit
MINSLKNDEFDVLIIGGGATGCGVALDAVSRGEIFISCKDDTNPFNVFYKYTAFGVYCY